MILVTAVEADSTHPIRNSAKAALVSHATSDYYSPLNGPLVSRGRTAARSSTKAASSLSLNSAMRMVVSSSFQMADYMQMDLLVAIRQDLGPC